MKPESPVVSRRRVAVLQGLLGFGFVFAFVAQARVHLFQRGNILVLAKKSDRFSGDQIEKARRGTIFSADGKALAQDDDTYLLRMSFGAMPKSPAFYVELANAAQVPAGEIQQLAASGAKFCEWPDRISPEQANRIESVRTKWRVDGVSLARPGVRTYPLGAAAACLVGLTQEGKGISGLELSSNTNLAGQDGRIAGLRDRFGNFLPTRISPESFPASDGKDIYLTIDSDLQLAATEAVKRAVEENGAKSGSAVVSDPKTGEILAMATWPTYDPNNLRGFVAQNEKPTDRNPATMEAFEPGSTFKILTLAKALDAGTWTPSQSNTCTGSITVGKTTFGCDKSHNGGRHGTITPEEAIAESCNVTASKWALSIGYEDFLTYLKRLGLLSKPGLSMPMESKGIFNREPVATQLQLALLGFGQAINVTPVALSNGFGMIGNNGVRMKPMIIKRIGKQQFAPTEAGRMVSAETANTVLSYMESVFTSEHGTGKTLKIPGYRLAGKTGTAQKVGSGGGHVSNFVGFVPAENPRVEILVMVDSPKKKYYGAVVAGPAFREIALAVIRRYSLPKTEPTLKVNP